ncbi:MAG: alginate export family protein [Candidatus Omnitrophota bacterium]
MKFLRILCVLAIALSVAGSVYAETQSVKVSGDLTMRALLRDQYNLRSHPDEAIITGTDSAQQQWLMSVAAVQIDADLTDNVQTVIRILNQRDWNVYDSTGATGTMNPNGRGLYIANQDEFDVMIDLAYVQLKNFIYSPLTVTIGRQDLWFGKGFIVGANQQNPGSGPGSNTILASGNLSAPEYTAINSFDAVKAVLDYDPWTITGIYSNIYTDGVQAKDGVDLWGVNVGYKFNSYNAESEAYWFYQQDDSITHFGETQSTNNVYTLGLRGSFDPINAFTLNGEIAWQGGSYLGSTLQQTSRPRSAWALDVSGECRYFADKTAWKPKIGAEYIYYSGDKNESYGDVNAGGTYTGWNPMYRGKFDSAIREFVGKFYSTARYAVSGAVTQSCADDSRTNQHQMVFMGSVQPIDSVTVKANYNLFWNQYFWTPNTGTFNANVLDGQSTGGFIGQEVDININWDYTEDVSFGLLAAWFVPNETYRSSLVVSAASNQSGYDKVATDLVGTVKVSF